MVHPLPSGGLSGADEREADRLVGVAIRAMLGVELVSEAIDRALAASAQARTLPSRRSIYLLAWGFLRPLIDREIDRRIARIEHERTRAA